MNLLWEQFVYASLRKHSSPNITVTAQHSRHFWKPETGYTSSLCPDIVMNIGQSDCIILDTKWKNLDGYKPQVDDLRQMYVYQSYYQAKKVALVYPGTDPQQKGVFYDTQQPNTLSSNECSLLPLAFETDTLKWQKTIYTQINEWIA